MRTIRTPQTRAAFLADLAQAGVVKRAAERAGISRVAAYEWREADPEFAAEWDRAVSESVDVLREAARQRSIDGWDEPVFQGGKRVGTIRKYSDFLLARLLTARAPEHTPRTKHEHTGADGGPIQFQTLEELARDIKRRREAALGGGMNGIVNGSAS